MVYANRIFPGVAVGGIDLSGQTPDQAVQTITSQFHYPQTGKIILMDGDKNWLATPTQLGYYLDIQSSVAQAYGVGRSGFFFFRFLDQMRARFMGINHSLFWINDQKTAQAFMLQVASEIKQPVKEASIQINGTDVEVASGHSGRDLDINATMAQVQKQLATQQDGILPVAVVETKPFISDLSPQADRVKKILEEPLVLSMPDGDTTGLGPWAIGQQDLANMLVFSQVTENNQMNILIQLNQDMLRAFLQKVAAVVDQKAANARFIFNDDTSQLDLLEHSQIGRTMDLETSAANAAQTILNGDHKVVLTVNIIKPAAPDTATAKDLGITGLIHREVSYFYGSDSSRVNNIRTAAGRFHGLLIAPGETLSMADVIGDVSLDSGFSEALIIYGSETIKGVGGGVCQVSTTLFRAAFFTGYPILERYAHAYRVGYYEQTVTGDHDQNLAGMDATVYVPVVDMKFKNDTPYWLLMETYVTETSLTWKFYSTSDGRAVDWKTTGPTNIVKAPDPKYTENKELPEGKIKQIDYSADGADITVDRTVTKDGQVYIKDTYQTHYVPWQAVYEYGPGTKLPKKKSGQN
jgi:vancomycin resistance protein YoaR